MLKKVIISGGGTGGHIFPAVAIANEIKRRYPEVEILFIGALGRMEMEKVPQAGYQIVGLPIAGIQRKLTLSNFLVPFKLINSILKAKSILKKFQPEVVIGVGGYASAAVLFAASGAGVPCVIQEQNSYAGLTNKWLSTRVRKICVAYSGMERFFPANKIVMTGNPVRSEIYKAKTTDKASAKQALGYAPEKPLVLVIGGSLGARTINNSIQAGISQFEEKDVQVLWQTGKNFTPDTKGSNLVKAETFIFDMCTAYAAADIVVSRAGAISVSELCLLGKPCILVPSPNVSEDHQTKNAMALVNEAAAVMVKDSEAGDKLVNQVVELINNKIEQEKLSERIAMLAKPDALSEIVNVIETTL